MYADFRFLLAFCWNENVFTIYTWRATERRPCGDTGRHTRYNTVCWWFMLLLMLHTCFFACFCRILLLLYAHVVSTHDSTIKNKFKMIMLETEVINKIEVLHCKTWLEFMTNIKINKVNNRCCKKILFPITDGKKTQVIFMTLLSKH